MKRFFHSVTAGLVLAMTLSCNGLSGGLPGLGKGANVNIQDAALIFRVAGSTKAATDLNGLEDGYWKQTVSGAVERLTIQDDMGKTLTWSIEKIRTVSPSMLMLSLHASNGGGMQVLANKKTGALYSAPDHLTAHDFSFEYGNILFKNDFGQIFQTDLSNLSQTAILPDGFTSYAFLADRNRNIAFTAESYIYGKDVFTFSLLSPDKHMEQTSYKEMFLDAEGNLYAVFTHYEEDLSLIMTVYRITYDASSRSFKKDIVDDINLGQDLQQVVMHGDFPWWPINEKNGRVVRFYPTCAVEFDGTSLRKAATYPVSSESDKNDEETERIPDFFLSYFAGNITSTSWGENPLQQMYWNRLPADNVFQTQSTGNTYKFYHIDPDTYEISCRELAVLPEAEYQVRDVVYSGGIVSFTAFRYNDSHFVSGTVDFSGKVTILTDAPGTYAVSNFMKLN